ncbi:hypothetical protein LC653_08120 [Nostoc sp. CHAB 5784]|uniref:hypothetical protein n=1 Tax=Nostoc mirabile TaxID=2907820 RepID=UPI001E57D8CB|nr:hypothetical protein [Nostoc mirabile]MCC5663889.1 hypothetical protein [Nostoc mirabile CHAB5784]
MKSSLMLGNGINSDIVRDKRFRYYTRGRSTAKSKGNFKNYTCFKSPFEYFRGAIALVGKKLG